MGNVNRSRGNSRDRHGRGVRRPLWSPRFEPGVARIGNFESTVQDAAEYLRTEYPDVFSELRVLVRDLPPLHGEIKSIRRYSYRRDTSTVIVFRIPIQRFRYRLDPLEEMFRIESYVIEAAAEMVGRDPRDFMGGESL
ncbi:MAG: hypothetical protein RIR34_1387 [Actinomycetota bacterium]